MSLMKGFVQCEARKGCIPQLNPKPPIQGVSQGGLTNLDSQSKVPGTAAAPWGSCRCTAGAAAPSTECPAAAAGSTGPSCRNQGA